MSRIYVAESFTSIQGEGLLAGTPSWFVRTSGCNLRCAWCDTPGTSWRAEGEQRAVADLVAEATARPQIRHAVVTGGEPALARNVEALIAALREAHLHVTLETAGSVPIPAADLASISPKLRSSTPEGPWGARHEARRLDLGAISGAMARGEYQLKFVVAAPADLDEIDALVRALGPAPERVLLMPEGVTVERLDRVAAWLAPEATARGHRFCDRLHIRLFGHTPGT